MTWKTREDIAAGAYQQRIGTSASSFTGVNVSSELAGNANIRGIATINSGTTVASVSAIGVASGDVIVALPYQYPDATTTVASGAQFFIGLVATSVRADAFEIRAINSRAPISNMPVAWFRIA